MKRWNKNRIGYNTNINNKDQNTWYRSVYDAISGVYDAILGVLLNSIKDVIINKVLEVIGILIIIFVAIFFITTKEDISYLYNMNSVIDNHLNNNLDWELELRYLDDYMEEPIEIEIANENLYYNKDSLSCFDRFINLFKQGNNFNLKKDFYRFEYLDYNSNHNQNFIENNPIINEVYKTNMENANNKIDLLEKEVSMLKIEQELYKKIATEVINLGMEALKL